MTERLHFYFSLSCTGEGNGNPLQCSCLENPRDSRAWWAAIYGVAQSQTRLKWLSSSSFTMWGHENSPARSWGWKHDVYSRKTKKVFSPCPLFLWLWNCSPATSQGTSFLPTWKTHKCSILINHFLSITLFFGELFLHWDIKDQSSLESLDMPPKGFMSIHHFAVFYWLEASHSVWTLKEMGLHSSFII